MKQTKFKGDLKRQHNEGTLYTKGTLDMSVNSCTSYKRPKIKKPKTLWQKIKEWLIGIT